MDVSYLACDAQAMRKEQLKQWAQESNAKRVYERLAAWQTELASQPAAEPEPGARAALRQRLSRDIKWFVSWFATPVITDGGAPGSSPRIMFEEDEDQEKEGDEET